MSGTQGELTFKGAFAQIKSSQITKRQKGLDDFKEIFKNRNNPKLAAVKDQGYHDLYEKLFEIVSDEKKNYLAGKVTAQLKLVKSASVLRIAVEAGSPVLKKRTVEAVIDHVIVTLPNRDGEYCSPLSHDYLKILRTLLSHKPRAENIARSRDVWNKLLDFCISGIDQYYEENGRESSLSRTSSFVGESNVSSKRSLSTSQFKNPGHRSASQSANIRDIEELLYCLLALVSTPNSPLLENAASIIPCAMKVIRFAQVSSLSSSHQTALSILNLVLPVIITEQTAMCKSLSIEVVQLIANLWPTKLISAQDEMLSTLLMVQFHLESVLIEDSNESLESDIRHLCEVLKSEYSKRLSRDQLQLEDVEMTTLERTATTTAPLSFLRLRPHNLGAERNWMLLKVLGILDRLGHLKEYAAPIPASIESEDESMHSRKRRRVTKHIDHLIDSLKYVDSSKRLTALQTLPFLLDVTQLSEESVRELLECLETLMADDSSNMASWAVLGIASCTTQAAIQKNPVLFDWAQVWHIGGRLVTLSNHCRAACHFLHVLLAKRLVSYVDIAEDISAMITSPELSGPTILSDSALSLMTHLLHVRNIEMPGASATASQNVIRWAFTKWDPIDSIERKHHVDFTSFTQPIDLVNLIRACLTMPRLKLPTSNMTPCTPIGQTWHRIRAVEGAIRYLLLLEDNSLASELCLTCPAALELHELENCIETNSHTQISQKTILDLCVPKFDVLAQYWDVSVADIPQQVSAGTVSVTIFTFLTGSCIISLLRGINNLPHLPELKQHLESLSKIAVSFGKESQKYDETLLQAIHPYLPSCQSLEFGAKQSLEGSILMKFIILFAAEIEDRQRAAAKDSSDNENESDEDPMLKEGHFDSREHGSNLKSADDLPREELCLATSAKAFVASTTMQVRFLAMLATSPTSANCVPSAFVDHLLSLPAAGTLFCRDFLREILHSTLDLNDADAARLLEHYAGFLQKNAYRSCEIVHGVCLDILFKTAMIWTSEEQKPGELTGDGFDVYQWFTEVVGNEDSCIMSTNTMIGFATLLLQLIKSRLRLSSSVKDLLRVLKRGDNRVKFYIGDHLSEVFGIFALIEHDGMFEEVVDNLPANPDCNEGIAYRMHVFALLASNWPTLIRRSVYHIFECPGRFPECSGHAARCFSQVSAALDLESARELFRLFSSQLLFTWLDGDQIDDIPHRTLGYDTLLELVQDAKVDITALMVMRAQNENLESLSALLEVPAKELIQQSFAKVMTYATAYDTSTLRSQGGEKVLSGEVRVKGLLGKPEWLEHVITHFAEMIALCFTVVDQDEKVDSLFSQSAELTKAGTVMIEMKQISSSEDSLPPNLQPTWKVKYLGLTIEHICRRAQLESSQIYTPTMVSFIARKLFNMIHPALGSLHTCAVLRKVRLFICIAGPAALTGYPLEMLLQSFRPYLTNPECVEDAIGVVQYLFIHGSTHLSQSPSFVSGIALSILASLRVFLKSSQASTTQDSQHKAIMSKAERFHQWLGNYLKDYKLPVVSANLEKSFQDIVLAAQGIRSAGNADVDSPESSLLVGLLEDEICSNPLLDRPSRDLAFSLLCDDFNKPASYREDVFGSDEIATKYAPVIWNLCRKTSVSKSFLAWSAKVIGRAFVANGHIHEELLRESEITRIKELLKADEVDQKSSSSILRLIQALTLGNNQKEVGLAESTLRFILSSLQNVDDQRALYEGQQCLSGPLYNASLWGSFEMPPSDKSDNYLGQKVDPFSADAINRKTWLKDLSIKLCLSVKSSAVVFSLPRLLQKVTGFAEQAFPFILHAVLLDQMNEKPTARKEVSAALAHWLNSEDTTSRGNVKLLLNALLYLRTQSMPKEHSHADRIKWLELDYSDAARAATRCHMFKTALLFAEISSEATPKSSRRSSVVKSEIPRDLLLSIFRSIDDPDSFYGVPQAASLSSVLSRLEYEKDGYKSLCFRGAQYDSNLRRNDPAAAADADSLVNALGVLRFDGLSHSLISAKQAVGMSYDSRQSMFRTARKLEQWDIPVPEASLNDAGTIYRAFQVLNNAADRKTIMTTVDDGLRNNMKMLIGETLHADALHTSLQSLSILTEMDEVLSSDGSGNFEEMLQRFEDRASWMKTGRFDDISHIISCRETLLSSLSRRETLRGILKIGVADTRLVEVRTMLLSSGISRAHGALQESLASTTYMTGLIQPCHEMGILIDAAVNLEAANSLWELGEMTSSIGLLQELIKNSELKSQTVVVGKSDLLAKLGYQVSTARLEMPDQIITNYLQPALAALKGKNKERESGQVFHEFAVFCDQQLQDPDGIEDLERLRKLREAKHSEVQGLTRMLKSTSDPKRKHKLKSDLGKAEQWYNLDNLEYTSLSDSRAGFLRQSLENYLLALAASDDHDKDALRFSAMWLENSGVVLANQTVDKSLDKVPTRKFAPLMNQLASRLLERDEHFQKLLSKLVMGVCRDHPYHGMYQIWAGTHAAGNVTDETTLARQAAAKRVAEELRKSPHSGPVWAAIEQTNKQYCALAGDDGSKTRGEKFHSGQKLLLKEFTSGKNFAAIIPRQKIPPPTMHIEIAANCDYSQLPTTNGVDPKMEIASGVSTPKAVTLLATDGRRYKQLVKGGTDDLRQDAIMEQVFYQVSEILQTNRSARQRKLRIRTYKVIPLTFKAGIIEWVPNSIPVQAFLQPAHQRYYPKDLKSDDCRKKIGSVQRSSVPERLRVFRDVCDKFHPVMRYFFIEKFDDPDEWFGKRLAYTRSTAANSVVGHILGLGDRHGHNILLDEKTGEAVHIDFGFAFETGRVLPVPESVPFRLTRDVVDGMGITGTEGVFRRCCEFTLAALRNESYSIMTVLDVLRYDPLYSWSVSPYRLEKLKNEQAVAPAADMDDGGDTGAKVAGTGKGGLSGNEPSEANRALTVVGKKLSKTLSVEAMVNDLINQATDERNLAVLYSGWCAHC